MAGAAMLYATRNARPAAIVAPEARQASPSGAPDLAPLLEALPDPAILIDRNARVLGANAAARRQMAFQPQGQHLTSFMRHPDVLDAVHAAIAEGATRAVEYETAAGIERHTRCTVAPVNWGAERGAMLVFNDQTARISTERLRADFLANASHELRTPLASLTLLIETIAGPAREDPVQRGKFLTMMQVQAERMRRLIDDLLSLSRIELDEHVPPSDRADLAVAAQEVCDLLAGVSAEKEVRFELSLPEHGARVVGERFQLVQVVQNLVDNAVKYTPRGGLVRVEVGLGGDREETIERAGRRWPEAGRFVTLNPATAANRSYYFVRVEDAGPGIGRQYLPRLGGRFFRVERELGEERGGTGLGLAIVKHIVNRHRGGLLVESRPGRGSAFAAFFESAH
jgi:two-component system, OmpR family, phosphate regulon sensor histidine kinase PhoR